LKPRKKKKRNKKEKNTTVEGTDRANVGGEKRGNRERVICIATKEKAQEPNFQKKKKIDAAPKAKSRN